MVRFFFSPHKKRCSFGHIKVQLTLSAGGNTLSYKRKFSCAVQPSMEIVRLPVNLPCTRCPRSHKARTLLGIHRSHSSPFPTLVSTHKSLSSLSWPRPKPPQHCCRKTSDKAWLRAVFYHRLKPEQVCQILARLV